MKHNQMFTTLFLPILSIQTKGGAMYLVFPVISSHSHSDLHNVTF